MLKTLSAALIALTAFAGAAFADDVPETLIVGLDVSQSNPLVADPEYAARVGAFVGEYVEGLSFKSKLIIRPFGAYGKRRNAALRIDEQISARAKPEELSVGLAALIGAIPQAVEAGTVKTENRTNVIAFLQDAASNHADCENSTTTVILATDGIEDSRYARVKTGASLPAPKKPIFAGCAELVMLGVGDGAGDPELTNRLRAEWEAWALAAGFETYTGFNDM